MAIQSVSSSLSAYSTSGMQSSQAQQAKQAEQAQQAVENTRVPERVEKKEEAPRPVVNAQGQQTGTLINITA